jgi:hypothetical protein
VAYDGHYAVPVIITRLNFGFFKMPAYLLDSQDQLFMHISLMYDVSNFVINHLDPLLKSKVLITFINSSMVLKLLTPSYYRSVRRAAAPIPASEH